MKFPRKEIFTARLLPAVIIALLVFAALAQAEGYRYKSPNAWSFGVHGDTQWTLSSSTNSLHTNKQYVNGEMIDVLNQRFNLHNVKLVIQVGDLSDRSGDKAMAERATRAQSLYNSEIGFFPLRGNHETYGSLYGYDTSSNFNVPAFKLNFPQTQGQSNTFGATNFSKPSDIMADREKLDGLSYSFDYGDVGNNARFLIVDVEKTHYYDVAAPNNPQSCVDAVTPGTPEGFTPFCGQGYLYYLKSFYNYDTGLVVYQATYDITNGVTVNYDSFGNAGPEESVTITTGTWFRIDSNNRPSTDFYAWDMANPNQTYNGSPWDPNAPPSASENRKISVKSSTNTEFWPGQQQAWIKNRLDTATRGTKHAFVFSHRPLMGAEHVDGFFGANPGVTPEDQNAFFSSLTDNGVRYMISGHDHIYNRAIVQSPNKEKEVQQIISIGASSKFYSPGPLSDFGSEKSREAQISQEINTVGYYIYTVDGPRVTVDYYSDATGNLGSDYCYPRGIKGDDNPYRSCSNKPGDSASFKTVDGVTYPTSPLVPGTYKLTSADLNFIKKETWGYSTNGKQFTIQQGGSYSVVEDSFSGTAAKILAGTNNSTATDLTPDTPRALAKSVNTGWVENPASNNLKSNILSLWGMSELGANGKTDAYVLQMSYAQNSDLLNNLGGYRLASLNSKGNWVKAVDLNSASGKQFVRGPYNGNLTPGAYGIDETTKTVWAVLDYDADFAVYNYPELSAQTSGFVYNRATRKYTGTVTLTNVSDETFTKATVVLTKLVAGASLVNKTGILAEGPYITTTIAGGLKPGASVKIPVVLAFTGAANASFIPVLYANN